MSKTNENEISADAFDDVQGDLMRMTFTGVGDEISVNTEILAQVSGRKLMSVYRTAIKTGEMLGVGQDDVTSMLFDGDEEE